MDPTLKATVDFIDARCRNRPAIGLILGSGLGAYADRFNDRTVIPYSSLIHFPSSTVPGHPGNLVTGSVRGIPCIALQGRIHFYEGFSMRELAVPVRVLGALGIRWLIVTNAAGAVNPEYRPGDLMLISDHINFMGSNPLIGANDGASGPRFLDMSSAYHAGMRETALDVARNSGITLRQGVYLAVTGPCYETPAEIRMFRTLGADAVGMSTVPEVIVASHIGMSVLGISCITNPAAGMSPEKITHDEVMECTRRASGALFSLLDGIIPRLVDSSTPVLL